MYSLHIAEGDDNAAAHSKILIRVAIVVQHQITFALSNSINKSQSPWKPGLNLEKCYEMLMAKKKSQQRLYKPYLSVHTSYCEGNIQKRSDSDYKVRLQTSAFPLNSYSSFIYLTVTSSDLSQEPETG